MLIACVQTDIDFADVKANQTRVFQWLEKAAAANAQLVVFPECMLTGYAYDSRESASNVAISVDSAILTELAAAAKDYGLHATLGFLESDGERLYNSAALIGPQGVVGVYRKIHLPHLGVDRFVDRGDIPYRTLAAGDANVGLAICYDSSFPEPMRVLGLAGADIIALGTNWPVTAARTADLVPASRSMENHLFFVAANRIGEENGFEFCGRSSICGPDGVVLAQSNDDQPVMLLADVDLAQARNKRIERTKDAHVIDRFKDRRPEFYGDIAAQNRDMS
ncbi:N-carbamoyl-D-amino acid hydrolase [Rubripirellula amarantea]|uniref:N-carbamoyl-D-amino acid hydrolase n=1 Tax=Rubripirellula amarantea TaxID=2527999 RepID=A0A5C5WRG1_9BACT|nr:carbon-nitrogen hydrolase family protein [Rubripirellula amarantea]TWT52835.1 N-carbamoyl-D-amino acid hydrolase [Rubripirellula amarantea]